MCHQPGSVLLDDTPYEALMQSLEPSFNALYQGVMLPAGFMEEVGETDEARDERLRLGMTGIPLMKQRRKIL